MRRRAALGAMGAAAILTGAARAQPRRTLKVGVASMLAPSDSIFIAFRARMAELGYVEGGNFVFDFTTIERPADYAVAYGNLIARGADILVAFSREVALQGARQAAAGRIPVVFLAVDYDPVQSGYVANRARPGGNLTGIFVSGADLAAKRVAVAHEALPKAKRLALWWDNASRTQVEAGAVAAKAAGVEADLVSVGGQPTDYDAAFRLSERLRADAIVLTSSPAYLQARAEIMRLAQAWRRPVIASYRELVEAGALLSYGVDLVNIFHDTALYIDRIARGAKPGDLPIAQPTRFELVINLKTAKTLGLTMPQSLLARADEVIE